MSQIISQVFLQIKTFCDFFQIFVYIYIFSIRTICNIMQLPRTNVCFLRICMIYSRMKKGNPMSENKSCAFRTSIGGQALLEGIMMRGPKKDAIVIRGREGLTVEVSDRKIFPKNSWKTGWNPSPDRRPLPSGRKQSQSIPVPSSTATDAAIQRNWKHSARSLGSASSKCAAALRKPWARSRKHCWTRAPMPHY